MTAGTLNIEGKKFRVIPEQDYQAMKTTLGGKGAWIRCHCKSGIKTVREGCAHFPGEPMG